MCVLHVFVHYCVYYAVNNSMHEAYCLTRLLVMTVLLKYITKSQVVRKQSLYGKNMLSECMQVSCCCIAVNIHACDICTQL